MASLHGLPPLPKSLSALLNFSSSQWKELERMHAMRTMIQQDLSRNNGGSTTSSSIISASSSLAATKKDDFHHGDDSFEGTVGGPSRSRLDAQLALLRKEMVGLRQLDMSLLCQLWSLNESIQEYKHIVQDSNISYNSSWDDYGETKMGRDSKKDLQSVPEHLSPASSSPSSPSPSSPSSHSSFEFGDI